MRRHTSISKHLNHKGFSHHILLPLLAILVVGGIGAYLTFTSKAATGVVSGRMAFNASYDSGGTRVSYGGTIESDGRSEKKLPGDGPRVIDISQSGNWVLSFNDDGTLIAYSGDLTRQKTYPIKQTNILYCDGTTKKYSMQTRFLGNGSATTPPEIVSIFQQHRCSDDAVLNNRFIVASTDGTQKTIYYDGSDEVSYGIEFVGSNRVLLVSKYVKSTSNYGIYSLTYYGTLRDLHRDSVASLALTQDGSKYIAPNSSNTLYDIYDYTGRRLGTTNLKDTSYAGDDSGWYTQIRDVNNGATKVLIRQLSVSDHHSQRLVVYDVATKKKTILDSGIAVSDIWGVFDNATFSSSGNLVGYTKKDAKYSSSSIRRINLDGSGQIVTKSIPFSAGTSSLKLYW